MKIKLFIFLSFLWTCTAIATCGCSRSQYIEPGKEGNDTLPTGDKDGNDDDVAAEGTKYNNFRVVGVDQFGRSFGTISSHKKGRQVGMFFFLWIGQPCAPDIYDVTKILAMPNGLKLLSDPKFQDKSISPPWNAHFWGEPLWGYYNSEDEWVIRKQIQMLTIAGVDFIFFDVTNAVIYKNVYMKILAVIDEYQKNGWNPPKVVFYTHSHSFQAVRQLYSELYQPNLYSDTWYRVDGKPMIMAYTDAADDLREASQRNDTSYQPGTLSGEILNFFHFLKPQWPFDPVYPDGFPWCEFIFPQPLHTQSSVMAVAAATAPNPPFSFSLTHPGWISWGRGWDPATRQNVAADVSKGTFFQSQWDRALSVDPEMISVCGWNEWIGYKQQVDWTGDEWILVDEVNQEYSRDIEPMTGGHQDSFYLQLIRNIRRYKGMGETAEPETAKTIDITGSLSQWGDVKYAVRNMDEKFIARDSYGGAQTVRYTQAAPVNKLLEIRVSHDAKNVYIYLKGKDKFSDYTGDENWLNIFVGTGEPAKKGWESYEYVIGRKIGNGDASVDKFNSGFSAANTGKARFIQNKEVIQLSIPRSAIGLSNGTRFYFKVAMDVTGPSDIMNCYQSGSTMPMGRLSYMYYLK